MDLFVFLAVLTAAAQSGPVVLKSPNGALEISIATVRGQELSAHATALVQALTREERIERIEMRALSAHDLETLAALELLTFGAPPRARRRWRRSQISSA